jgi:hypothetical protein
MKKIRSIVLVVSILAFVPATSYALFDIGIYGGYTFAGEVQSDISGQQNPEPTGLSYGAIAHFNTPIFPLLRLGIGLYTENSDLEFSIASEDYEFTRKTVGVDLYLQLDIPLVPLHPYAKFASGIWEEVGGDLVAKDETEYFNTYRTGLGAALTFFPMLQIFAEYQFLYTRQVGDDTATGHGVALGLRLNI